MGGRAATWAIIILALIGVGGIAWWALYPRPTDEDRLRALIARLERGVEDKDPNRVMALFSEGYRDHCGLRHKDLSILLLRVLRTRGDFEVAIAESRLEITGREATATLQGEVTLSHGSQAQGRYFGTVTLLLRKDKGEWKIVATRGWQERVLLGAWGL